MIHNNRGGEFTPFLLFPGAKYTFPAKDKPLP